MRFEVIFSGDGPYYYIKDNQARTHNMPEMAVTMFFASETNADIVCAILNGEWRNFLRNPS